MNKAKAFCGLAGGSLIVVSCAIGGDSAANSVDRAAMLLRADAGGSLLLVSAVQKELKLSNEQIAKIDDLAKEMRVAADALGKRQEAAKKRLDIYFQGSQKAAGLLMPEQLKRMRQIQLQYLGPSTFLYPEVEKQLNLTVEQKKSIIPAYNEGRLEAMLEDVKQQKLQKGFPSGLKIMAFNKAAMAKIMAILTEEQRREYSKMVGETVEGVPRTSGGVLKTELKKDKQK